MKPERAPAPGITGTFSNLYDVFVDWPGRLGRELPGIERHLAALAEPAGPRRVLDVGCGTGRHVQALAQLGHDAHGADVSEDMLAQARELLGDGAQGAEVRLHRWRLGDDPPASVRAAAPFDAVLAMGNVWPQVLETPDVERALAGLHTVLRPGGLVLFGMKAVAVRAERGDPYMPLLRRVHGGKPLWFVRFVDFEVPPRADGTRVCDFHMVVVVGDANSPEAERETLLHRATRMRVWDPPGLERCLTAAGFESVRVAGNLADPSVDPRGEDVFVSARAPSS